MWNNTETLDTISKLGTWGATLLGLLAGAAGFVAVIARQSIRQTERGAKENAATN